MGFKINFEKRDNKWLYSLDEASWITSGWEAGFALDCEKGKITL